MDSSMTQIISIHPDGTLQLPFSFREKLGLSCQNACVELTETGEGLLLRGISPDALEDYSEERMAEFEKNNEEALVPFSATIDRLAK
jgi:hypothetical protein